jgi:hypothetical protein
MRSSGGQNWKGRDSDEITVVPAEAGTHAYHLR